MQQHRGKRAKRHLPEYVSTRTVTPDECSLILLDKKILQFKINKSASHPITSGPFQPYAA